jgi:hypothetical protein
MSALVRCTVIDTDDARYLKGTVYTLRLNNDHTYNEEGEQVPEETEGAKTEGETGEPEEAETATGIPLTEAPGATTELPEAEANPVDPPAAPAQ